MTIYERYGGYKFFHELIYKLYLDMFDHPEISYHFIGVNIERLSQLQAQFLCKGVGGKIKYEGLPIAEVHKNLNISEYQFDEIAKAFHDIFLENGVSPKDAKFILNFIARYKKAICSCKYSWIDKIMIPIYHNWDRFRYAVSSFGEYSLIKN